MVKSCGASAMLSLCVPLVVILLTTLQINAQSEVGFDATDNSMAMEAQRRLIMAVMRRQAAINGTAPAPEVSSMMPEAASDAHSEQDAVASFAGTAIPVSTDINTLGRGRDKQSTAFPVMSTDQLEHLSDPELFQIFHKGTAEIPSDLPGQRGGWLTCTCVSCDCSCCTQLLHTHMLRIVYREIHCMQR